MTCAPISYKRRWFPLQIITHVVWLYHRFSLSLREVEEMLLESWIMFAYETIRQWGLKFGPAYGRRLRRKRASNSVLWYFDEVVIRIQCQRYYHWRAVDQECNILDIFLQKRRNTKAAKRLLTYLLSKQDAAPKWITTDKLGSYWAAKREMIPAVEHRSHKVLNLARRTGICTYECEGVMEKFNLSGRHQRFLAGFSDMCNFIVPSHHLWSVIDIHFLRLNAYSRRNWKPFRCENGDFGLNWQFLVNTSPCNG